VTKTKKILQSKQTPKRTERRSKIDRFNHDLARHKKAINCAIEALNKYKNPETHTMDSDGFLWSVDYADYDTASRALEEIKNILNVDK
jgi:hypothetical protein